MWINAAALSTHGLAPAVAPPCGGFVAVREHAIVLNALANRQQMRMKLRISHDE
jgi:hypothetical protein